MNLSNITVAENSSVGVFSTIRPTLSYTVWTQIIIRTIGVVTFVLNILAMTYILRLWKKQKRENSFYIQMTFVCANDVGCGFVIIIMSVPVQDVISVYLCGFSHIILNTLVCMALGNIFFICLQRYIFARNIRSLALKWKSLLSKTLLTVNVVIGVGAFTINLIASKFVEEFRSPVCSLAVFRNFGLQTVVLLLILGLPTMLASDVLCVLAILKLRRAATIAPLEGTTTMSRSSDNDDGPGTANFRSYQQRAIITVLLILLAFNFSTVPNILSTILGFCGIGLPLEIGRLLLFCIFINSLANPLIYITRIQSLRSMFVSDLSRLKSLVCRER